MDDLLSEKEQIEQIRSWWSEYGSYVVGGIVIGAGILFGINYTQNAKLQAQLEASDRYETLTDYVADGKLEDAELLADEIIGDYADTTYAAQTGLAMARLYMDKNRDQDATDALAAVVDSDADDALRNVARLRLARIFLYQDKAQEVVDLLDGETDESFAPAYNEVLGDAYTALGRIEDAQAAYQTVLLNPLAQGTVDSQLVQWKALDLPEVVAVETAAEDEMEPEGLAGEGAE
ncbi:MAG: tetratricopeptide repeat protein [Gammaproteobacteria bacterium]|nr:tetratricopeptide repeat protein [Gammaproteobacteria bacterium]